MIDMTDIDGVGVPTRLLSLDEVSGIRICYASDHTGRKPYSYHAMKCPREEIAFMIPEVNDEMVRVMRIWSSRAMADSYYVKL